MPTPEGAVKNWIKTQILKKYSEAYIYVTHVGQYGKRGVPDLVMCIKGLFVTIEVKTVNGKLTALQEKEGRRIEESGGIWMTMYGRNEDQLDELYETIEEVLSIRLT
jgi:Holliday junction resolvase-like predicted endonuclease